MPLKYLFTATYKDGSTFEQSPEDASKLEPGKRSAYFDVKQDELKTFSLKGEGHTYSVDLEDGHFEINGVAFVMHEEPISDLRLIFWRTHKHLFRRSDLQELDHTIVYKIGWQCTVDGKNVQRVMQFI